jgi:hypothetical protein
MDFRNSLVTDLVSYMLMMFFRLFVVGESLILFILNLSKLLIKLLTFFYQISVTVLDYLYFTSSVPKATYQIDLPSFVF